MGASIPEQSVATRRWRCCGCLSALHGIKVGMGPSVPPQIGAVRFWTCDGEAFAGVNVLAVLACCMGWFLEVFRRMHLALILECRFVLEAKLVSILHVSLGFTSELHAEIVGVSHGL